LKWLEPDLVAGSGAVWGGLAMGKGQPPTVRAGLKVRAKGG